MITVSVITNTAFEFVQREEKDFLNSFQGDDFRQFENFAHLLLLAHSINVGKDVSVREQGDDPYNFELFEIYDWCCFHAYTVLEAYVRTLKPNTVPIYRPDVFGAFDPQAEWFELSPRRKFEEDKRYLSEHLAEPTLMARTFGKMHLIAEDELTRGLRQMSENKELPIWLVFATQVFLDIHHVVGPDVDHGMSDLENTGTIIKSSVQRMFKCAHSVGPHCKSVHEVLTCESPGAMGERRACGH